MIEKAVVPFYDTTIALILAVAAVAGMSGACLVVANLVLRGRSLPMVLIGSYVIAGVVISVAAMAACISFGVWFPTIADVVLYGIGAGALGSMLLAATNLSARFIARRLGFELDIQVRRLQDGE